MSSSRSEPPATAADPLASLPHRPPFRFLTRVVALEAGRSGRGQWDVTGDEAFLEGHFPGRPLVPGVLIAEALAQLAGIVAFSGDAASATSSEGRPAALAHVDVRFRSAVEPPATVDLRATLARSVGAVHMFDVDASVGDRNVARGALALVESTAAPDRTTEA
jgi:3-hydroxyacyl-[acyl-carrier-protein] dehydratase